MSHEATDAVHDLVELASKVVGKEKKIVVNTKIYKHGSPGDYGTEDDIIELVPLAGEYLELSDILRLTKHMKNQMKVVEDNEVTYIYEGLDKGEEPNTYSISWGS